jgi:hypothetical protein
MIIVPPNTATRIPVRLTDGFGVAATGKLPTDVLGGVVTIVKSDGTTVDVTLLSSGGSQNWFEPNLTKAPGLYHLLMPGTVFNLVGPCQMAVVPSASGFVPVIASFLVADTSTASILTRLGTPSGASVSADIATAITAATGAQTAATAAQTAASSASTNAATAATAATIARKIAQNHWKVTGNQLIIYDDNKTTPLYTFNLFDDTGAPSQTKIFERTPV